MGKKNLGYGKYLICVGLGILFYLVAEGLEDGANSVENGVLKRNPCGQGETVYEFSVGGLDEAVFVELTVPEQKLSGQEFRDAMPEIAELVLQRMAGENSSLQEVRTDLDLVRELPEYGVEISWQSEQPDVIGVDGSVYLESGIESGINDAFVDAGKSGFAHLSEMENESETGVKVWLEAEIRCGEAEEVLEIPVVVYPPEISLEERFQAMLEELVLANPEQEEIALPKEFEGASLQYRYSGQSQNMILLILGVVAAICLFLKEKEDVVVARKQREDDLMAGYPDFVYGFLILTGAGYSAKAAWKKMTGGYLEDSKKMKRALCEEMKVTLNQMEIGTPEVRAYAEFGRRCGIRSYVKFASLLESSISTGGKNLRKLLEAEVEEAFQLRIDLAKRKGEEASAKLLLLTFAMLGVVMVMVMAPAFLTIM